MSSPRCPSCNVPGTLKCSSGKDVCYCSQECQQADCPTHKLLCKSFKDFERRPNEDMRRVIFFPHDRSKPEFHWLEAVEGFDGTETVEYEYLTGEPHFWERVERNDITGTKLNNLIMISYDDHYLTNYVSANRLS